MKLLWVFVICCFIALVVANEISFQKDLPFANLTISERQLLWMKLSTQSASSTRNDTLKSALHSAAGVYRDKIKSLQFGLQNTVLLQVVSYNNLPAFHRYRKLTENLFCFEENFGLKTVVFVLAEGQSEVMDLDFPGVQFLSYPHQLFWALLAQFKDNDINTGYNTKSYEGVVPSFANHGALVSLVPAFEVLSLGYDVLFIDLDVALVRDPIPYLTRGNADLVMQMELRSCDFPSRIQSTRWNTIEPNTGLMLIRNNKNSFKFYENWLKLVIQGNVMNDQKVMDLSTATHITTCNTGSLIPGDKDAKRGLRLGNKSGAVSFCYLNEFLFQNGLSTFHCANGLREGTTIDFMMGMATMGAKSPDAPSLITPVVVHANYCDDKEMELTKLGLWLAKNNAVTRQRGSVEERCAPYNISNTLFANWTEGIAAAKNEYQRVVKAVPSSVLLKFPDGADHFIFRGGKLRSLSSPEAITRMGFDVNNVTVLDQAIHRAIPRGREISAIEKPPAASLSSVGSVSSTHGPPKSSGSPTAAVRRLSGHTHEPPLHRRLITTITAPPLASAGGNNSTKKEWNVTDILNAAKFRAPTQTRVDYVTSTAKKVAGVYRDKEKAYKMGIEKTVLVNVLASNRQGMTSRYIQLLKNWFCFATQNGYQSLTYLLPTESGDTSGEEAELRAAGINSNFVSYPTELFWKIIGRKTTGLGQGPHRADYEGDLPSFSHHGALVMLVPTLEVLRLGYNVIYFDLDLALVQDPIPFMTNNTVDMAVSLELRTCIFPSLVENVLKLDWEEFEPNTGVMFVRSTPGGLDLYTRWLDRLVNENFMNDQLVLKYQHLGAKLSFSCNPKLAFLDHNETFQHLRANSANFSSQLCFFNEFMFQNGKMVTNCAPGRGGSISEYLLAMHDNGYHDPVHKGKGDGPLVTPIIAHLNYCDDKIVELTKLGLWLPHQGDAYQCRTYDVRKTTFASLDWPEKLKGAQADLAEAWSKFSNGSIVKLYREKSVYLVLDGVLRPFPDGETYEAMGFDWMKIKHMKQYAFTKNIPIGPTLPSLK